MSERQANNGSDSLLRKVLSINAWISGLTGLVVLVLGGPVDDLIGTDAPTVVRAVGAGLILFAGAVYLTARADRLRLRSGGTAIMVLDVLWVVASVIAVVAGWFSGMGNVLVLAVAAVVGLFAVGEWRGLQSLARSVTTSPART